MKKCNKCNAILNDDVAFCTFCGTSTQGASTIDEQQEQNNSQALPQQQHTFQNAQNAQNYDFLPAASVDNRKTFCIMSYIGIFWLLGLLVAPEKFDKRVRFNVGQGIIASIFGSICLVAVWILTSIISVVFNPLGYYQKPVIVTFLNGILWTAAFAVCIFYMVYGIVKVSKNQDTYLPIIGRFTFIK